jgi:sensor domain CHASE-containing protein
MTGFFGHPSRKFFILRAVIPFFAAAILLNFLAAGLLYWSTAKVDRISMERQSALTDLVVSQLRARIALDQESVTVWDDAVEHVRAPDDRWLDFNLGSWMNTYFGHDAAYIVDPEDQPIYASIDGASTEPGRLADIWSQTKPLIDNLRDRLRSGDETGISDRVLTIGASEIAEVSGRPAIISVKPIVSDSGEIEQVAGEEFLHVAVRYLDDNLVQELESQYLLEGLRFSWTKNHAADEALSPLRGSTGQAVGYYVWTPYRPGSVVFGQVWPVLDALVAPWRRHIRLDSTMRLFARAGPAALGEVV